MFLYAIKNTEMSSFLILPSLVLWRIAQNVTTLVFICAFVIHLFPYLTLQLEISGQNLII